MMDSLADEIHHSLAVETCSARVLEEGERRIYGWTVFSPEEPNMRFTQKLEEKILLVVSARRRLPRRQADVPFLHSPNWRSMSCHLTTTWKRWSPPPGSLCAT